MPALDLIRGLAALTVMLGHARGASFVDYASLPASQRSFATAIFFAGTRLGHQAVIIFFVLSGFLVGRPLIERVAGGRFNLRDYAIDRVARIGLPLFPAVIVAAWLGFAAADPPSVFTVFGNALGLNGVLVETLHKDGPLWSLAYEIWFYVLGGALAYAATGRMRVAAIAVICCAVLVFTRLDATYLLIWGLGAVVLPVGGNKRPLLMAGGGLLVFAAGMVLGQLSEATTGHSLLHFPQGVNDALVAIGFALCLPFLAREVVSQRLTTIAPAAGALSAISYSLYLIHAPVIDLVSHTLGQPGPLSRATLLGFALEVAASLAAGSLFYALFERQTPKLRQWLRGLRPAAVSMTA